MALAFGPYTTLTVAQIAPTLGPIQSEDALMRRGAWRKPKRGKFTLVLLWSAIAGVAAAEVPAETRTDLDSPMQDLAACVSAEADRIDDGNSDVATLAKAIKVSCRRQVNHLKTVFLKPYASQPAKVQDILKSSNESTTDQMITELILQGRRFREPDKSGAQ